MEFEARLYGSCGDRLTVARGVLGSHVRTGPKGHFPCAEEGTEPVSAL